MSISISITFSIILLYLPLSVCLNKAFLYRLRPPPFPNKKNDNNNNNNDDDDDDDDDNT